MPERFEGLFEDDEMVGPDWQAQVEASAKILPADILKSSKVKANQARKSQLDNIIKINNSKFYQ